MKKPTSIHARRGGSAAARLPAYKNPALAPEKRVKDLLSRMTLEEKEAQMTCVWQEKAQKLLDAEGNFDPAKAKSAFKKGLGLGQVGRPSDAGAPAGAGAFPPPWAFWCWTWPAPPD